VITEGGDRLRDGAQVTLPRNRRPGGATNSTGGGAGEGVFGGVGG